ncbi:MAG: TolB family protein [Cytophagales bacterium]
MKKVNYTIFTWCVLGCSIQIFAQQPDLKYLNEVPPGTTPKIFAPGKVSKENETEFGSVFSNDMTEFFYSAEINGKTETRMMKFENGKWSKPATILFHDNYSYNDPFLTPDNKKLFFISNRSLTGIGPKKDYDIWYIERLGNKWSAPKNAGKNINSPKNEYYISFTKNGKMYFSSNRQDSRGENYDIYSSELKNGEFQPAVKLGNQINTPFYEADVFIASDESYVIFSVINEDGIDSGELYVSFRNGDNTWTQRKSLGESVNSPSNDFCPYVSPDGKFLFYAREQDIYWVSIDVIKKLR